MKIVDIRIIPRDALRSELPCPGKTTTKTVSKVLPQAGTTLAPMLIRGGDLFDFEELLRF
jgi:hypothetical protein